MNNGMKEGGAGNRIVSPAVPGIILVLSAALSALGLAKGSTLIGLLFMMASAAMLALLICMRAAVVCCVACPISVAAGSVIKIGRASVGKECVRRCRSRWSPYH